MRRGVAEGVVRFVLPQTWHLLAGDAADVDERITAIISKLAVEHDSARQQLTRGLRAVTALALGLPGGARTNHALVSVPESGVVDALLSIRLSVTASAAYDNYVRAARSVMGTEETELIRRTVDELEIPGARAVASRDFTLPRQREGIPAPAMERAFLAVFPHEAETVVEFSLFTQNLALFDDPTDFLIGLASGRIDDEESP